MRYFSVQEADAFVPALQATFGDIEQLRVKVVVLVRELEALGEPREAAVAGGPSGLLETPLPEASTTSASTHRARVTEKRGEISETLGEIRSLVRDLETHGVIVKQLDGLVDFRALRGQRPVYLSWRRGEARVGSWHEVWTDPEAKHPVDHFFSKPLLN